MLLPTYKLLILLFIVTLCANTASFFTVTIIVFIASAPLLSVTLYVTLYVPTAFTLTVFSIIFIFSVIFPSSLSVAFTPSKGSNFSPRFITLSEASIWGIAFIIPPGILGFTISSSFSVNTFLSSAFNFSLFSAVFLIFMFI